MNGEFYYIIGGLRIYFRVVNLKAKPVGISLIYITAIKHSAQGRDSTAHREFFLSIFREQHLPKCRYSYIRSKHQTKGSIYRVPDDNIVDVFCNSDLVTDAFIA